MNNIKFPNYLQLKILDYCWNDLNKYRIKKKEKYLDCKIKWKLYLILVNWLWFKHARDNLVRSYSFEYQILDVYKKYFTNRFSIQSGIPVNLRISTQNISTFLNHYYEFNGKEGVRLFFSELKELEVLVNCDLDFNDYDILFSNITNLETLSIVFREKLHFVYPLDFEFYLNSYTIFTYLLKNSLIESLSLDLTDRETLTVGGNDNNLYADLVNVYLKYAHNLRHLKLRIHHLQKYQNTTVFKLIQFLFTSSSHNIQTLDCNISMNLPLPFKLSSSITDIKGLIFNNCSAVQDIKEPLELLNNSCSSLLIPKNKYPNPVIEYLLLNSKSQHITIDFSLYGIEQLKALKKNNSVKFLNIVGLKLEKYQLYLDQILLFIKKQDSIILTTISMDRKHTENWSLIRAWLLIESSTNKTFSNTLLVCYLKNTNTPMLALDKELGYTERENIKLYMKLKERELI
ncbi:hypothetical protein DICPUDRAFT_75101 [Dictyostelium purpureum]|uniref:F-box domain-containing protein n=1 Tax=Dictyostelium purpureum TaxID=5786 RepID=F0Z9N2_DICPU|nr:uncharacterized protein DICPUDRAFT_75101 [Dictyostelium purpureum]EGC39330.1 hypothetical protein DICPUDRAFT_75101 [Dictyostelium purpureum]|eukprot:XP_003284118.1 hypothetical protein DICPUDRAFT_75101 [Dictyostelium purpureum]